MATRRTDGQWGRTGESREGRPPQGEQVKVWEAAGCKPMSTSQPGKSVFNSGRPVAERIVMVSKRTEVLSST